MSKAFRLAEHEIRRLVLPGRGAGIASDLVLVDGHPVRWMYRERATETFSGWSFFSDLEDAAYTADPRHFGVYDLNVIANYDPAIIELLDEPPGSAFAREDADCSFSLITRTFGMEPLRAFGAS